MSATVAIVRATDTYAYNDIDVREEVLAGYAAASLEAIGFDVRIHDFKVNPSLKETEILAGDPILIVFVVRHPGDNLYYVRRLLRALKRGSPNLPHCTLYGHSKIAVAANLREHSFDSVVLGEEADLVGLARLIQSGETRLESCPGIAWLDESDAVRLNGPSPLVALDDIPRPKRYFLSGVNSETLSRMNVTAAMQTSRGCYARCSFCFLESERLVRGGHYPWRARSIADVVDEMRDIINETGVRSFYFYDTDFFGPGRANRTRASDFAEAVIDARLDIEFLMYARATDLNESNLDALKAAGLTALFLGIESFSQPVLDRYNKATTVEENQRAIALVKQHDVFIQTGYITFDYFTTFSELRETAAGWAQALSDKPELFPTPQFVFTVLAPLDGTPIAETYRKLGVLDTAARHSFPSWIIPDIRMKSPAAPYVFRDPAVSRMAECCRLLSYEIAKKIVRVHKVLNELIADADDSADVDVNGTMAGPIEFLSTITQFSHGVFQEVLEHYSRDGELYDGVEMMFSKCRDYYRKLLSPDVARLEIYDSHYSRLRQRASGFIENTWENLLEHRST